MVHLTLLVSTLIAFLRHHKKSLIAVSFIVLFIFSALRYGFGNDYFSYLNTFNEIKMTGTFSHISNDVLYVWLNKIMPTYQMLLAVTSFIFLFAVYMLIKRNVNAGYHGIAVFIFALNPYIFLSNLSAMRQCLAMVMLMLAVYFALKKKPIIFIVLILLASLFHFSAIVFLPLYFIANEKKISRGFIIAFVAVLGSLLLTSNFFEIVLGWFEEFTSSTHIRLYLENEGNSLRSTILTSLYLVYVLMNVRKLKGKTLAYTKLYMFALFFAILAYKLNMMTRLQQYLDIFSLVALPGIIEHNYKNEKNDILKLINVYLFPALLFVVYILRYYSFFTNDMWESYRTYQINLAGLFG